MQLLEKSKLIVQENLRSRQLAEPERSGKSICYRPSPFHKDEEGKRTAVKPETRVSIQDL